jgi:hypothetical protein
VPGTGLLAACIPGTFDTWMTLLRDYGTMRVSDVLSPAIGYARNGYPLVERICATIDTVKDLFRDHWPTSARSICRAASRPKPGSYFTNPTMADTYERILREATNGGIARPRSSAPAQRWSKGFVAEAIDKFCRTQEVMDTSGRRHRGVLTADDLAKWQATVEAPISYDYGRYTVLKAGPWTQGLVTLQQLALLKGFSLDGLDPAGPDFIHLQVECAKLAFADRDTFYGDPKFVDVPVEALLSEKYNTERRKLITDKASHELRPGTIEGFGKKLGVRLADAARAAVGSSGAGSRRSATFRGRTTRTICPTRIGVQAEEARAHGRHKRRHRALRHHRPRRQHGVVDAVRRLAAFLAGHPGAWFPARHPRADVLARGGAPGLARTRQAPALDAHPDARAARRRAVSRLGLARRRPAGPVDHAVLPAPCPCRHEPAGGDRLRRPGIPSTSSPRSGRAPRAPA